MIGFMQLGAAWYSTLLHRWKLNHSPTFTYNIYGNAGLRVVL